MYLQHTWDSSDTTTTSEPETTPSHTNVWGTSTPPTTRIGWFLSDIHSASVVA